VKVTPAGLGPPDEPELQLAGDEIPLSNPGFSSRFCAFNETAAPNNANAASGRRAFRREKTERSCMAALPGSRSLESITVSRVHA